MDGMIIVGAWVGFFFGIAFSWVAATMYYSWKIGQSFYEGAESERLRLQSRGVLRANGTKPVPTEPG